ncbi:MAG: hypothetical protein KF802_05940 [Bdellovibrionaceae bacterium]|nr:hypothetical protein [Pseudobdellovibrionaceae bacterium]MBX3032460.1 hypothetical protein [Pseudobdellovibrionaceae bacterium]
MNGLNRVLVPAVIAALLLSGCSEGMKSSAIEGGSSNVESGSGVGGINDGRNPMDQVDMKGYVSEGAYQSVKSVDIDKVAGELIVRLPLGMDATIAVGGGSIPQLPGVTFGTEFGADGNAYFTVRIPLRYVLRGVTGLPSTTTLPNGRPLPKMPAGEYPSVAFTINSKNTDRKFHLYLGVDAVGLYVESKWLSCGNSPICLDYLEAPIKNEQRNKVLGYLTLMLGRGQTAGGFFVSTIVPPEIAKILDEYFLD